MTAIIPNKGVELVGLEVEVPNEGLIVAVPTAIGRPRQDQAEA